MIHVISADSPFADKMRKIYTEVGITEAKDMKEAKKLAGMGVECFVDESVAETVIIG